MALIATESTSTGAAGAAGGCDIIRYMTSSSGDPRAINPARQDLDVLVRVPGSKSVTNRALLLAGLAAGRSVLRGALDADDANAFAGGLRSLGVVVERRGDDLVVDGAGGRFPAAEADVYCAEAGTAARFLVAAAAAGEGTYRFDAAPQLRRRPLGLLLQALRAQGARTEPGDAAGLPLTLLARGLAGGSLRLPGDTSSQFISALLLAAPLGARAARPARRRPREPALRHHDPAHDGAVRRRRADGRGRSLRRPARAPTPAASTTSSPTPPRRPTSSPPRPPPAARSRCSACTARGPCRATSRSSTCSRRWAAR